MYTLQTETTTDGLRLLNRAHELVTTSDLKKTNSQKKEKHPGRFEEKEDRQKDDKRCLKGKVLFVKGCINNRRTFKMSLESSN